MKILVTGSAGFIGSNIVSALQNEGHTVTGIDHRNSKQEDASDRSFWQNLPAHFDAVLHQAACTDTTVFDEAFMLKQNVHAFEYLLDWAEAHGIDVIYASSAATYGNAPSPQTVGKNEEPINIYGKSKLMMDNLVRQKLESVTLRSPAPYDGSTGLTMTQGAGRLEGPIKIVGLRYFNVYGPGEAGKGKMASMVHQLAQQMKQGNRPRIFKYGEQARDQIYVGDVIQANLKALAAPKEKSGIYNVGTGKPTSFNTIVETLNAVFGTDLEPEYIDNPYVGKYQDHTCANIDTTKRELGFEPEFDIQKGIKAYWESGML